MRVMVIMAVPVRGVIMGARMCVTS
jgi:hypothetical protein